MNSFAVLTPSRGLVHSRSVEAVMVAVDMATAAGHEFRGWRFSHDLPIPDCHNAVAEAGLATGADALWFVEEDVIPPPDAVPALFRLLETCSIAALDYPVAGNWSCVCRDVNGAIRYTGLGCTLVRRALFERSERPWFRSDTEFQIMRFGDVRTELVAVNRPYDYGGQDIYFSQRALADGFTIGQVPDMTAGHCRIAEWGKQYTNDGAHQVTVLDTISRFQTA